MLYGLDDYETEFSLVERKLNIKKVIIVAAILFIILVLIIYLIASSIIKKHKNSSENLMAATNTTEGMQIHDNNEIINDEEQEKNNQESIEERPNDEETKKKNEKVNDGKHLQIPQHDLSKLESKFVPIFNENAPELIKDLYYSDEKQVYLTFDDGPSKDITPQILDILKDNDVKATFFVLGSRVELYPDMLKREYNEGHYIANHGYSHKYSQIYQSRDTVFEEYRITEETIKKALDNPDYNTYLFRFPGGSSGGHYERVKSEARDMFREYGIAFTNWNCLTGDAENKTTKEACIQEMLNTKGEQNSIVLLMHDANDKQHTVDALPDIIQYYKNEGYTFKNFYEIFR